MVRHDEFAGSRLLFSPARYGPLISLPSQVKGLFEVGYAMGIIYLTPRQKIPIFPAERKGVFDVSKHYFHLPAF